MMSLCVRKYELTRAPGDFAAALFIACSIAKLFLASPIVLKTTTVGGRIPVPNSLNVFWFVSYAGLPGIEKLWNQRLLTWLAANIPKSVSANQAKITARRCRETK